MSDGRKYGYAEASHIAGMIVDSLRPFCDRIEIAGSIRRQKREVGDIEIVCIPRTVMGGLFGDSQERHPGFIAWVNKLEAVRGQATGKYTQRITPYGIKLDLFMATADNWGLILAIRTGSADFSAKRLAARWVQLGYHSVDGMLTRDGEPIPVREEADLFSLLGMAWVDPIDREWEATQ